MDRRKYILTTWLDTLLSAAPVDPYASYIFYDSATRADNPTSPGSATEKGGAYVQTAGVWGISSNRIFAVQSAPASAVLDFPTLPTLWSRIDITMDSADWQSIDPAVELFKIDDNNFIVMSFSSGTSQSALYKKIGGAFSALAPTVTDPSKNPVNGVPADISFRVAGSVLTIIVNGVTNTTFDMASDDDLVPLRAAKGLALNFGTPGGAPGVITPYFSNIKVS